jgi:formiminotetrahydrofolate cyclodeaminase
MNDDYYNFTIKNSDIVDGLHLAKTETLICLKSKAFTDMAQRHFSGQKEDSKDIKKHLNDVIKLTLTLPENVKVNLSETLKKDKELFFEIMKSYNPDFKSIGKDFGLPKFSEADFIRLYYKIFL